MLKKYIKKKKPVRTLTNIKGDNISGNISLFYIRKTQSACLESNGLKRFVMVWSSRDAEPC